MHRRRALLRTTCTAALLLALPVTASAQKPPKNNKPATAQGPVTLTAKPSPVVFGSGVVLSGRVDGAKAGIVVTLQRRARTGGEFTSVTTAATDSAGRYTINHKPLVNTIYRVLAATAPAQQSGELLVYVRMLVGSRVSDYTPRARTLVRFTGLVYPAHNGRLAYIQRLSSTGRWFTVVRTSLRAYNASSSRYNRRIRVNRSGTYRVRVLGHDDHAMGISRTRTLTVH